MKQLERLLFLQGNVCFFCRQAIPPGEASIEHLVALSNGGTKVDENCVACCKSTNAALGNLSVKAKLQVILTHRGIFVCPKSAAAAEELSLTSAPLEDQLALVVVDLQKRGATRPRKPATLRNTINSVFQNKLTERELSALMSALQECKFIAVQDTKVSYTLPQVGA